MGQQSLVFAINSLEGGGAERVFCNVIDGVRARLPSVSSRLVLLDTTSDAYAPRSDVETVRLDCGGSLIASARKFKAEMSARPASLCLSFLTRANCANVMSASSAGHAALISERVQTSSHIGNSVKGMIQKQLIRMMYPRAAGVIAVSEGVRADLIEHFGVKRERTEVVYNSVDVDFLNEMARKEPAVALPERYLVSVGRLQDNKNFPMLVRAYAQANIDMDLVILGDGPARSDLESLARELGVGDRVHLLGFCPNPFAIVARAHGFVSASNAEGFPNALVEAMSLGLPCAFTNCPSGPAEILADDYTRVVDDMSLETYGILMPTNDVAACASALSYLSGDEARARYGEAATSRARMFSPEKTLDTYAEIIERQLHALR